MPVRPSTCRSCGAHIVWGRTDAGKSMPVDPSAVDDGNIVYLPDGKTIHVLTKSEKALPVSRPRFKSHFATCPTAARHRGGVERTP